MKNDISRLESHSNQFMIWFASHGGNKRTQMHYVTRFCAIRALFLVSSILAHNSSAMETAVILSPQRGERISDLRPMIEVRAVEGAETYLIEISPDPIFFDRNTISYLSSHAGVSTAPMAGTLQRLRLAGLNKKYERYSGRQSVPNLWKIPYNLTAVLTAPYGHRIIPCRDWLSHFADLVIEGHDDPLQALNEFVSFSIMNEGSGSGYFSAYEVLSRNMGVCGNTAELLTALSAAKGLETKILSLKAPDQGHVVASTQRPTGEWVLMDGLYNIMVEGDVLDLIDKVKSDPNFLDIEAFDGVDVPYRHFFTASNYAYQTETSKSGIHFTTDGTGALKFKDLRYACGADMAAHAVSLKQTVISNIFFVRTSHFKANKWAPWSYSYFVFQPAPSVGQSVQDNSAEIWHQGLLVPDQFLGGKKLELSVGTAIGSAAADGYDASFAMKPDSASWVSTPWSDGETQKWVGYDLGEGVTARSVGILVGWVSPVTMPMKYRIQGSRDGQSWATVKDVTVEHLLGEPQSRLDHVMYAGPHEYRFWRLAFDRESSSGAIAVESITLLTEPSDIR